MWVLPGKRLGVPSLIIFLWMAPVLQLSAVEPSLKGDSRVSAAEHTLGIRQVSAAETAYPGGITAESQQPARRTIKGKIVDHEGRALPGVTITVLGTTRGVITDNDGSYSIETVPTDKLVFSFIGMESQIVDVGNQTAINITMAEKTEELENVTVVAFAKQKKESVLASIGSFKQPDHSFSRSYVGDHLLPAQRGTRPGQCRVFHPRGNHLRV